jgi:hypothetical protein
VLAKNTFLSAFYGGHEEINKIIEGLHTYFWAQKIPPPTPRRNDCCKNDLRGGMGTINGSFMVHQSIIDTSNENADPNCFRPFYCVI